MDQRIINLYDEYTHKPLSRQDFLKRLALLTGSMAAAMMVLPSLELNYASAATVNEGELFTERIVYPGINGEMQAYLARPKLKKAYPAVIVIHENRGMNTHIEDVTRRAAKAGFLAIAPNALSPLGGTPPDEDKARELFQQLKAEDNLQNFVKIFDWLPGRKDFNGKTGAVGFCWGGAMANKLAVNVPALDAAVAFYGSQPSAEEIPKIKAAVQLHYAELDTRINAGIAAYEKGLKEAAINYELYMYEGAQHAFHNDTSASRYNEAAAKLAWKRTIAFFEKHLA